MIKVLLVDDEKLERVLIRKGFDWAKHGFEIIGEASSAAEALKFIQSSIPDLILTDINMPQMNGLELTAKIRKQLPNCQIVIVTGYREFDYARRALKLGVTDFLLKPINMEEIAALVETLKFDAQTKKAPPNIPNTVEVIKAEPTQNKRLHKIIIEALDYVSTEIYNPDLSLKLVASKTYSNESYLSRLFKQEIGVSLIEYITQKRINESIRLLNETDLKVYEVAEQVGFRDAHYFGICFKKRTGLTIKEFKSGKEIQ
ncbi:response regulator transcription factor [Candidatus Epulonipiscium viviparus]|uniref:response regulator transcription factor n=1 Tax=Candidatus Epulonipiscium viviparus TaxID=420336 RepID=UPI00016C0A10|nr:response regulator [Candidatus Epulopiscium viviparus]